MSRTESMAVGVLTSMVVWLATFQETVVAQTPSAESSQIHSFQLEPDELWPQRTCVVRIVEGQLDGEARFYVPQGDLCMIEHYAAGVLDGERLMFYPNGNRFGRLMFRQGVPVGEQSTWYPDGTPLSVTTWSDGFMDGPVLQYWRNGNLKVSAKMVRGAFQGERLHFLPNGRVFGITEWVDGRQVGQRILLEPTRQDIVELEESALWVGLQLKDIWTSE